MCKGDCTTGTEEPGAKVSGAKVSGAKVSGAKVSGAEVSGAEELLPDGLSEVAEGKDVGDELGSLG
jgi:hypothetical protein